MTMPESVRQTITTALTEAQDPRLVLPLDELTQRRKDIAMARQWLTAQQQPEPLYSHRNGETDAPTEFGYYWFRGNVQGYPVAQKVTVMRHLASGNLLVADVEEGSRLDKFDGQWWGPIVEIPPWESAQPQPAPLQRIVEQLRWCNYSCEAGALEDNTAWRELERLASGQPATVAGPDWSSAPEWAMYWAVNANLEAFWYAFKPFPLTNLKDACWQWSDGDEFKRIGYAGEAVLPIGVDWRTTLHQRPTPATDGEVA
jgi:hypothetical protein